MKYNIILLILLALLFFSIIFNPPKKNINNNFIDKIIYINLDHRDDRRKEIEHELNRFNLKNYERFPAIKHSNGAIGCSKSHLAVIKKAKKEGYKNILVLEDDFEFIVSKEQFYEELSKLSKVPFDVTLFAYNTPNFYDSSHPFLHKIKDAQTASAYIINSHYYDTLISQWEQAIINFEKTDDATKYTCDQSWKPLQEKDNWYCFKLRIGKQRESYSDIQKGVVNYNV